MHCIGNYNNQYKVYHDENTILINTAYFSPVFSFLVYLASDIKKPKRVNYILIDYRFNRINGTVVFKCNNATEMLEFILDNVIVFHFPNSKNRIYTRYNNFRSKYDLQGSCAFLVGIFLFLPLALFLWPGLFDGGLVNLPFYFLIPALTSFASVQFAKIMYDEK